MNKFCTLLLAAAVAPYAAAQTSDASGQTQQSQNQHVHIAEQPSVQPLSDTSVAVSWKTNVGSSAVVRFGTDRNNLDKQETAPWNSQGQHRVEIRNLQPKTTYFFRVESGQAQGSGTMAGSRIISFETGPRYVAAGDQNNQNQQNNSGQQNADLRILAGPIVQNVKDTNATLWWMVDRGRNQSGQAQQSASQQLSFHYGTEQGNLNQSSQLQAQERESTVSLSNLEPGRVYYYELRGQQGDVKHRGQFETLAANYDRKQMRITHGPVIEYLDDDAAIVAWSTTRASSTRVRYGTDPNNLNQTATAPWGTDTHRVRIANLKPGTTYYFVVESSQAQGSGAMAKSDVAPFQTLSQGEQAFKNPQPRIPQ